MDEEENKREDFKVIICGSREFSDYEFLRDRCDNILSKKKDTHHVIIVSGAARGADTLGEKYATERGYDLVKIPANWDKYGKRAGYLRNIKMAEIANGCIGFIVDGVKCSGTEMMLRISQEKKLKTRRIVYKKSG